MTLINRKLLVHTTVESPVPLPARDNRPPIFGTLLQGYWFTSGPGNLQIAHISPHITKLLSGCNVWALPCFPAPSRSDSACRALGPGVQDWKSFAQQAPFEDLNPRGGAP